MITHILCVLNQSFLHVTVFICNMNTVTAPLTPHTTQGTDMDAETSKAKPQPWPPSPEAPVWVQGKPEHCCPGNRATWSSRLGQHRWKCSDGEIWVSGQGVNCWFSRGAATAEESHGLEITGRVPKTVLDILSSAEQAVTRSLRTLFLHNGDQNTQSPGTLFQKNCLRT